MREYKSHTFKGSVKWTGGRTWDFAGESSPMIHGSSPVRFRGEEGKLTPEDLLLASVNTCIISTFSAYLARKDFEPIGYTSEVEGLLEHTDHSGFIFTKIKVKVYVTVGTEEEKAQVIEMLEKAHKDCWMSNSLKSETTLETEVIVAD